MNLTAIQKKYGALVGAVVVALLGADTSGYTIDTHSIIANAPWLVLVLAYLELRLIPWATPLKKYAESQLGPAPATQAAQAEDLTAVPDAAPRAATGPIGIARDPR